MAHVQVDGQADVQVPETACERNAQAVADESFWTGIFDAAECEEFDPALCVALAKYSGVMDVGKAVATHNDLVREAPDFAAALYS